MTTLNENRAPVRISKLYRVFGPCIRPYTRKIGFAYASLALSVATATLRPWPLKYLLDSVILRKTALPWMAHIDPEWVVVILCASLVAIVLLESTAGYFQKLWFAQVGHSTTTDVLEHTFTHLQTLPRTARPQTGSGDLIVRLTTDVKTMRDLLVEYQQKFITYILTFAVTGLVMARVNWRLTLLGLSDSGHLDRKRPILAADPARLAIQAGA